MANKNVTPTVTDNESLINIYEAWSSVPPNLEQHILDVTGILQQKANRLRSQPPVSWLPYLEAELISQEDYTFLNAFQHAKTKEDRDELLHFFKNGAFETLVRVVQRVCVVEEIQKFLILIDDMLWEDISRVENFNPAETEPWKAFLDLLSCSDDFVRNVSSRIISKLITQEHRPKADDVTYFLNWLKNELTSENVYLQSVTRCLQRLLRVDEYRVAFMSMNGIFRIIRLLDAGVKPQSQYQLSFCLWVASFNPLVAEKMNRYGTIPALMDVLEKCPNGVSKLSRMVVATLRNLLEKPREEGVRKHNAYVMIQCKIFKYFEALRVHYKMTDQEHKEDLEMLENTVKEYLAELSTFDEYHLEVKSGRLEWTIVHTSKTFWKKNAARLNENNYELLRILVSLLESSKENIVLCVAAHDLGEYMSNYPRGKRLVEELGGKEALLRLLSHDHPVVKYHALKSLQILMLNNYDLLLEHVADHIRPELKKRWEEKDYFGM